MALSVFFGEGNFEEDRMAIKIAQKKEIVEEVAQAAKSAVSAVLADYRGMSVAEMNAMRVKGRDTGVYLRVVRNTLAKKALAESEFACLEDSLVGPTLMAFSQEDPGAAARLLKDYSKEIETLEVKAIAIGGESLGPEQLDRVASLPTLDEARSMLLSVMLAPVTKLTRTLNDIPASVTRVISAIRDNKQTEA
jgi:large subunit ribosomal protein L10